MNWKLIYQAGLLFCFPIALRRSSVESSPVAVCTTDDIYTRYYVSALWILVLPQGCRKMSALEAYPAFLYRRQHSLNTIMQIAFKTILFAAKNILAIILNSGNNYKIFAYSETNSGVVSKMHEIIIKCIIFFPQIISLYTGW